MASRPKQTAPRPAPRLYLVTPPVADADAFASELAASVAAADIAAVLLRLSQADDRTLINCVKALAPVVQDKGAALLLDGHPDIVARSGADGAHLSGPDNFSAALPTLKPDRIAGAGDLPSRHDCMVAAETGADYILFGQFSGARANNREAILERVGWLSEIFELPCVGFAESADQIAPLVAAGADFVALDYVWSDPRGAAAALADAALLLRLPERVS